MGGGTDSKKSPSDHFRIIVAPLSFTCAMATGHESVNSYCDLLEDTLKSNGIFKNVSRIVNCDETGIPLTPPSPKVLHAVGEKI